ncbi:amidase [Affinibrenneria salicis]|uniref:Amidase n=1 Tax=Affinibrenneria salicis TaxID=2590031 RepID=A0A5J5FZS0_9GAMM|nr:amidase [Affinibrenneria salicis]KAA8999434.1 amidase [Affinibrenneria salicis]
MNEILRLSMCEAGRRIRAGRLSFPELLEACLQREAQTRALNAFNQLFAERARRLAIACQSLLENGYDLGPLHGMPLAIKANIALAGEEMHAGSRLLAGQQATADSAVVRRLKRAGALIIGTTNMHEFAWGGTTDNPHYGATGNAWDSERIPAGSSGGSGAAAAVRSALATLGTDTGGSVRLPASMNGVTGLRPGIGRIDTDGIFPLAWSMDTAGPLAAYAEDCAQVYATLAGEPHPPALSPLAGLRIGLLEDYCGAVQPAVARAYEALLAWFAAAGARCCNLPLSGLEQAVNAQVVINVAEPSAIHAPWIAARSEEYGEDVRLLLQAGNGLSALEYLQAQRYRSVLRQQLLSSFDQVDVILTPTLPFTAPRKGQARIRIGEQEESVLTGNMHFTCLASLAGLPALSLPAGFDADGLPIGMQLIGADGAEHRLLDLAIHFQQDSDYHRRLPPLAREQA